MDLITPAAELLTQFFARNMDEKYALMVFKPSMVCITYVTLDWPEHKYGT